MKVDKRVIGIWSPKSGVGKSFITANVGAYLAKKGMLVGIIEGSRQNSSIPNILNINIPKGKGLKYGMHTDNESDIIKNFHENPKSNKDLFVIGLNKHDKVDELNRISGENITRLYTHSREQFNVLLIDMPSSYMEFTSYLGWFFVDTLIVVVDNDINSVMHLRKYLTQFRELSINMDKLLLVVNKDIKALDKKVIKTLSGLKISSVIPFSKNVISDMNNSKTIFQAGGTIRDKRIAKEVKRIADIILLEPKK